jgi:N-acetylmuramoyl-L-alanine amidase
MRTSVVPVLAVLAACAVSGKPAADLQVTAVRFWTLSDVTRIAIEANGDFNFKRDQLTNPDRLFFDIVDARPNVGGLRFSTRQVNDRLLKQIRIAETMPGRTRVVLDLTGPVDYTVSKLENPDRLMIELRPTAAQKKFEPKPTLISTAQFPIIPPAAPSVTTLQPPVVNANLPDASPVTTEFAKPARPEPLAVTATFPVPSPAAVQDPPVTHTADSPARPGLEAATPARKSTSDGSRSLTRALGLKINRVVIDAGHGGHDVGTTGPTGLLEKDLVLDVALRLGKLIEQRLGAEVIYTRHDDTYIALEERTAIANRSHADLFLSVHANSSPIKAVAGVETYYLNFTTASDSLDVAARENASSQKTVFELRDLIQSISLHDKIDESKEFAVDVQRSMQAHAVRYISTAKDRGIKKAPFVVLIGAQMPSVLSEIGFISNPREESLLKRGDHRQQIAEALYKGVSHYSDSLSHIQVASQATSPVAAKPDRDATGPGTAK